VDEKEEISVRLREEIQRRYGTMKALADAIGRSLQYVNIYASGINSPGPKVRELLRKAGLDVAYIMTGRRREESPDRQNMKKIMQLLEEKGIRNVGELRRRLEQEEALARMLGPDLYSTIIQAAVLREKKQKYSSRKKRR
jgi:transcriptional regulator with XRE-family HTH domain